MGQEKSEYFLPKSDIACHLYSWPPLSSSPIFASEGVAYIHLRELRRNSQRPVAEGSKDWHNGKSQKCNSKCTFIIRVSESPQMPGQYSFAQLYGSWEGVTTCRIRIRRSRFPKPLPQAISSGVVWSTYSDTIWHIVQIQFWQTLLQVFHSE